MDFNNLNFEEQIEVDVTTDVMVRVNVFFPWLHVLFKSVCVLRVGYM